MGQVAADLASLRACSEAVLLTKRREEVESQMQYLIQLVSEEPRPSHLTEGLSWKSLERLFTTSE